MKCDNLLFIFDNEKRDTLTIYILHLPNDLIILRIYIASILNTNTILSRVLCIYYIPSKNKIKWIV